MHIAINCRSCLNKNYTGIGRYTYHLIQNLAKIDQANRYTLFGRKGPFDLRKKPPAVKAKNFSVRMDYRKRGPSACLSDTDIYHAPSLEDINFDRPRVVVTVHDLIFKTYPRGHTAATIQSGERQMQNIVKYASKIICCSKSTMDDLMRCYPVPPHKITLIYEGVDRDLFYPVGEAERGRVRQVLKQKGVSGPFVLFVGTIEPRKNLPNILRAFFFLKERKRFSGKLVIAGMKGWMSEGVGMLVQQLRLENDVVFPGYLTNDELRYLYNETEVFVFPSFYEGFGLPILEAFSSGAAVITSNVSSCPEIAGDAALTVDPSSIEAMTDAMARVIHDPKLKADLKARGLKRVEDFSFEKMAEETLGVYRGIYASK